MRSMEETQVRWEATRKHCTSVADLQRAVRGNGPSSPCLSGCRSVCWKTFLLFQETDTESWIQTLRHTRETYTERRDHFLKFIRHPESLAEISSDPLNDDPESPWNTFRQDELTRAEIEQDVKRLPNEANYHDDRIQMLILDVLFIYCKLNPGRGGYRQGMHELLAPIVHVLEQDAVKRDSEGNDMLDQAMLETLDAAYIEHDAYALFSKLMEQAQFFYEVKDVAPGMQSFQEASSAIVERSKHIHEVLLNKIDPDLAAHLTNIEILPQIFLIRWVRLLFSREFPFSQFLVLWDTLFATDPSLNLIDLVSCAMLLRIRWQLLQADYSVCLQLLLKYPAPDAEHGPHTFVSDAVYLRDHLDFPGGSFLIQKYTAKSPATPGASVTSPTTAAARRGFDSIRQRALRSGGSSLPAGGVEQLLQGAAKSARGVLERSEKLGINQAVREAMGELRRNMQNINDGRIAPPRAQQGPDTAAALAAMDRRGKQLASFLNETVADLKALSASNLEDKAKSLQMIEVAAAKVQFVQIYLEDSTMDVPVPPAAGSKEPAKDSQNDSSPKKSGAIDKAAETPAAKATDRALTEDKPPAVPEKPPAAVKTATPTSKTPPSKPAPPPSPQTPAKPQAKAPSDLPSTPTANKKEDPPKPDAETPTAAQPQRPHPQVTAVPTRSTIAQSSFSWMLEPDETTSASAAGSKSPPSQAQKKRSSNNVSRGNAFLFGGDDGDVAASDPLASGGIFGLESMSKGKTKKPE